MTHELEINGKTYEFNFGMAFVRDIDKRKTRTTGGIDQDIGLAYYMAMVVSERNLDALFTVLKTANKGFTPRLEQNAFDAWVDDEDTDIEAVFNEVEGFFARSNCCKTMYRRITEVAE